MKSKHLLFSVLFCMFWAAGYSAETEPNDTKGQATKLNLNSSNSGAIGGAVDVDWWKVTTTSDGKLDVTLAVSNGLYCYYDLYDNNGTTLLKSSYTNGTASYSVDGLAPGTYFIKNYPFTAGQLPAYTISNVLNVAPLTVDVEPNALYTQANVLSPNGSVTGHIGYYYNLTRDTTDWWKITTTGNGSLNLTLASSNGQYVYWELFDANGTTLLKSQYTNGTAAYTVDGLAAGTYYLRNHCFYSDGFAPYTISSVFTAPPVSNDTEPNNTKGQAKNLPLNNSKTGHVGYYYNLTRDTTDWWKITTTSDGLLKLNMLSHNSQYVYYSLYDNNGTTLLHSSYTNGTQSYTVDGLAAGTYYVRVYCFYSDGFAPYTLTDSLFTAPVANDVEPNDGKAQALNLTLGSTVTGHVGYYYNLQRDSADWYKIVTPKDGQINITLSSENVQYVWQVLYDNDGTTVLNSGYSNSTVIKNTDGLAAGTYYLKVYTFYSNGFTPYTLTTSLSEYANANDGLNNEFAKKAATLPVNNATPGHVGFRFNGGSQDMVDWWKINYTGNGDMTVSLNWESRFCCGATYTYMVIYKDTNATALFNTYNNSGNLTANLTNLDKGYYWVNVHTFYSDQWVAYNITPDFSQKDKAKITLQSATVGTNCTNGALQYKCTKSSKPYTVQLYQYGKKYGSAMTVNNTNAFTISNLPPGTYYATAYGDGATGTAKGTSETSTIVPVPTNTNTTSIKKTKATVNWDALTCIKYDSVYYRVLGSGTWTKVKTPDNTGTYTLNNLVAGTTYQWQVAHVDTGNAQTATSAYTSIASFVTLPPKMGEDGEINAIDAVNVYPNPVSDMLNISFESMTETKVTIRISDATGRIMETTSFDAVAGEMQHEVNVAAYANGIYFICLTSGDMEKTVKFTKQD